MASQPNLVIVTSPKYVYRRGRNDSLSSTCGHGVNSQPLSASLGQGGILTMGRRKRWQAALLLSHLGSGEKEVEGGRILSTSQVRLYRNTLLSWAEVGRRERKEERVGGAWAL